MADSVQIAVFEGGELKVHKGSDESREAVLALPLSRLLVKMVKVPAEQREDPVSVAAPVLQAMSPFPDEPLTVSCETVRETEAGLCVLAAALPESAADDIGEALDGAKLTLTRVDATALGRIAELWPQLNDGRTGVRRLLLMREADCLSLFVLDDDHPSAVRALSFESDLKREVMLSLLEAEEFGGPAELAEVVTVGEIDAGALSSFAPVRAVSADPESVAGLAARAADPATLDVLPASWREMLEETRFKAKLVRNLSIAVGVWVLVMAVLLGVPFVYGLMTDHQKSLSREHAAKYREVKEMKEKLDLVKKYSDHSRGALEILKAVSDRLPDGVELNSWTFKHEEGVRFAGESVDAAGVYTLKNRLLEAEVFAEVNLTGPSAGKGGKQKFDIDCRYEREEED